MASTAEGFSTTHSKLYLQGVNYWHKGRKDQYTRFKPFFMGYFERPGRTQEQWDKELADFNGDVNMCKQEYPRTAEEAMQANSKCTFNVQTLRFMYENAPLKPMIGSGKLIANRPELSPGIYGKCNTQSIQFIPQQFGAELKIYLQPDLTHPYIAGIDCGMGVHRDYTVCQIFDMVTGEQAAIYRNNIKTPEQCADDVEILCKWYGEPLSIIERDGPGLAFLQRFKQIYNQIYGPETLDGFIDKVNYQKLGTSTRRTVKEAYIGLVQSFIYKAVERNPQNADDITGRSKFGWLYDMTTIEECLNYVTTDTGKMEADREVRMELDKDGSEEMHDDTVIALMQCCIKLVESDRKTNQYQTKNKPYNIIDRIYEDGKFEKHMNKPLTLTYIQGYGQ